MGLLRRDWLRWSAAGLFSSCTNSTFESRGAAPTSAAGETFSPNSPEYEALVRGYNSQYHHIRPKLITMPRNRREVVAVLNACRAEGWQLHLRGGGHSFEDLNTGSGVLLDTRRMNAVYLASDKRSVTVGAGATLGAVQQALFPHGLAIPTGSCPSVGVAGLTMGGGYGFLSRRDGLTCDALTEVELVDANGRTQLASQTQNADLFWALRGGGGGQFGVVTQLTFSPRAVPPRVCVLQSRVRRDRRREFLEFWQSWIAEGPDELTALIYLAATDGGMDGPVVLAQYWGSRANAAPALAPFKAFLDEPEPQDMTGLEAAEFFGGKLDAPMKPARFKSKSHFFGRPLGRDYWQDLVALLDSPIKGVVGLMLDPWRGAIGRVPRQSTAFPHRDALFSVQYRADWDDEAGRNATSTCLDRLYEHSMPASQGAYVNYSDKSLTTWQNDYYGENLTRLREIKGRIDPDNFFRHALSLESALLAASESPSEAGDACEDLANEEACGHEPSNLGEGEVVDEAPTETG